MASRRSGVFVEIGTSLREPDRTGHALHSLALPWTEAEDPGERAIPQEMIRVSKVVDEATDH